MIDLSAFRVVDEGGRPLTTERWRVVECLKGSEQRPRWALRVHDGQHDLFVKVRLWRSLRQRVRATAGRSYIMNEVRLRSRIVASGIRVPALVGWGWRRAGLWVDAEALLLEWLGGGVSMAAWVEVAAGQGREADLRWALRSTAALLARVRQAGLADKDFGLHNLMLLPAAPASTPRTDAVPGAIVWTDLERVYRAAPDDADATAQSAAATLARWWLATAQPAILHQASDALRDALPVPRGGWSSIHRAINELLAKRVCHSQIDAKPPPPAIALM